MRPPTAIETARLTLRAFRESDVDPLYAIQGDREAMRHTHAAESRDDCARWLGAYAALESSLGYAPWTAVLRAESRVIGWGLVRAALHHGFAALALPAVGAFVRPANAASARVLDKCGFALVGYEPRLQRNRYEVLRSDWLRATAPTGGAGESAPPR
jgi:[ribosomal protein S5]-alanine N-acetyltransferase